MQGMPKYAQCDRSRLSDSHYFCPEKHEMPFIFSSWEARLTALAPKADICTALADVLVPSRDVIQHQPMSTIG